MYFSHNLLFPIPHHLSQLRAHWLSISAFVCQNASRPVCHYSYYKSIIYSLPICGRSEFIPPGQMVFRNRHINGGERSFNMLAREHIPINSLCAFAYIKPRCCSTTHYAAAADALQTDTLCAETISRTIYSINTQYTYLIYIRVLCTTNILSKGQKGGKLPPHCEHDAVYGGGAYLFANSIARIDSKHPTTAKHGHSSWSNFLRIHAT